MTSIIRRSAPQVGYSNPNSHTIDHEESKLFTELQQNLVFIEEKLDGKNQEITVPYDDTFIRRDIQRLKSQVDFYIETLLKLGFKPGR